MIKKYPNSDIYFVDKHKNYYPNHTFVTTNIDSNYNFVDHTIMIIQYYVDNNTIHQLQLVLLLNK